MLIVDDNGRFRGALREYLALAFPDVRISEAADGASALEQCRSGEFRVVLLDFGLPDTNGIDLIAPIKALRPACAVIGMSQHAIPEYAERARARGAFASVVKMAFARELVPAIERALGASESP